MRLHKGTGKRETHQAGEPRSLCRKKKEAFPSPKKDSFRAGEGQEKQGEISARSSEGGSVGGKLVRPYLIKGKISPNMGGEV